MTDVLDLGDILDAIGWFDGESLGDRTVARAIRRRLDELSLTPPAYAALLRTSSEERQNLTEELVVPETYFLRHEQSFEALTKWAFSVALKGTAEQPLRLLSAACSSGEECYSVALTLLEAGLRPDRFRIDAADISHRHLAVAREALYGTNSFRTPEARKLRDVWCAAEGNRYRLKEEVCSTVTFHHADLTSGPPATGVALYQVIFCRNVLIYFNEAARRRTLANLRGILAPDGLLFLGPSDLPLACREGFTPCEWPMSFAVRKGPAQKEYGVPVTERPASDRRRSPTKPPLKTAPQARPVVAASVPTQPKPPPVTVDPLAAVGELADRGRLDEALRLLTPHLATAAPQPQAYLLLGLINDASGNRPAAESAYRKALYLDPANRDATLNLCLLLEATGRADAAAPFRRRLGRDGGEQQ
jgi:chemotaxis protein methyltransferase WspC